MMRAHLAALAGLAVLLAACGGGSTAPSAGGARQIPIEMKAGFAFSVTSLDLKAGERVVLTFKNSDSVEHEFMAGRQATGSVGFKQDLFADVKPEIRSPVAHDDGHGGGGHVPNVGIRLKPGQSGSMSFVVPDKIGDHEIGCFVAGHYESGMKGTLTIAK